jgi:hypothetical protein
VVQLLLAGLALWAAATAAAALGATLRALAPAAGRSKHGAAVTKYVLVIDSGSSGTRMYAYNWTLPAAQQHSAAGSLLPVVQSIPPDAAASLVPKKEKKGAQWQYRFACVHKAVSNCNLVNQVATPQAVSSGNSLQRQLAQAHNKQLRLCTRLVCLQASPSNRVAQSLPASFASVRSRDMYS